MFCCQKVCVYIWDLSCIFQAREPKAIMRIETLNATFQPAKIGNPCGLQITYLRDNSTRNIFVYHEDSKVSGPSSSCAGALECFGLCIHVHASAGCFPPKSHSLSADYSTVTVSLKAIFWNVKCFLSVHNHHCIHPVQTLIIPRIHIKLFVISFLPLRSTYNVSCSQTTHTFYLVI